ncbi:MAG: amidohydrolase family protein [Actinomycetota bacterium]
MSSSIPLLDSLTHPMPDGGWTSARYDGQNHIDALLAEMDEAGVAAALAVGTPAAPAYGPEWADWMRGTSDRLHLVEYCPLDSLSDDDDLDRFLAAARDRGAVAVKVHPRHEHISITDPRLARLANLAGDLPVFLCTYFKGDDASSVTNTMDNLHALLESTQNTRWVLLHGCTVRLLEASELARAFPNVLLDLSYTLCRYAGSSLDLDMRHLFETFDQRLCLGSDFPEFRPATVRHRFETLAEGLPSEKQHNIAWRNLATVTGIQIDLAKPDQPMDS